MERLVEFEWPNYYHKDIHNCVTFVGESVNKTVLNTGITTAVEEKKSFLLGDDLFRYTGNWGRDYL